MLMIVNNHSDSSLLLLWRKMPIRILLHKVIINLMLLHLLLELSVVLFIGDADLHCLWDYINAMLLHCQANQ